jgi:hypothetical protein
VQTAILVPKASPSPSPSSPSPRPRATAPGAPPGAGKTDDDTYLGLPRRVRQASLAPQLRRDTTPPAPEVSEPVANVRTPEEIRRMMSSYQRGTIRGRAATVDPIGPEVGPPSVPQPAEDDVPSVVSTEQLPGSFIVDPAEAPMAPRSTVEVAEEDS